MSGHKLSDDYIRRLDRMLIEHERSRRGDRPQRRRTPQVLSPSLIRLFEITDYRCIYDSTEKAWKINAKQVEDEKAAATFPTTPEGGANDEWLWMPRPFPDDAGALASGFPLFSPGQRVYGVQRNGKYELLQTGATSDNSYAIAKSYSVSDIPAWGVVELYAMSHDSMNGRWMGAEVPRVNWTTGLEPCFGINGPTIVSHNDYGRFQVCNRGGWKWALAAIGSPGGYQVQKRLWGPIPGSFELYPGLPGFITERACQFSPNRLLVRPVYGMTYEARVKDVCADYVTAYPTDGYGGIYNGVSLPQTIELKLRAFYGCSSGNPRTVNVQVGTTVHYTLLSKDSYNLLLLTDVYDARVGAIRMELGTMSASGGDIISANWAHMDGHSNSSANGGSGVNMIDKFPKGASGGTTGGTSSHTHTTSAGSQLNPASATKLIDNADHLPPWRAIRFWERLNRFYYT